MSDVFQFKHFAIKQNLCAMKVGTDGVLLGAWTKAPTGNVLDIGCGSGLISLMIAQRNPNTQIDAIDVDQNAFLQTTENIANSEWKHSIKSHHTTLQNFTTDKKYQLIVSNPPFFVNATKSANNSKNIARHTDELSFNDLLHHVSKLLEKEGVFSVVLPIIEEVEFCKIASVHELFLNRICYVKPNLQKEPKRILMEFSLTNTPVIMESVTIETEKRHHYTEEYRNLTQDFYLHF
ncbi:MAG: methyltransferase [Flavobacteriales bacterium]|nr:methyltransferase [Flavobacteriales bacterium]